MEALDPNTWVAEHGDYLFRVARRQLRSDALAEDAVQEALRAALSARDRYSGGVMSRTWLTGILKHKIIDLTRRQAREAEVPRDEDGSEDWDALFKADGHWENPPREWQSPETEAELTQLRVVLLECADKLKPAMARVFSLLEVVAWKPKKFVRNGKSARPIAGCCFIGRDCF